MKLARRSRHSFNQHRRTKRRCLEHVTFNLLGTQAKRRKLEGRDHLVVPCVMITEGVHSGNRGPGLYTESEIAATVSAWNAMPAVVYHPEDGLTARDAQVLNDSSVGIVLNTQWDRKRKRLTCDLWLDLNRTNQVDDRIIDAIKNGQKLEVSTGLTLNRVNKSGEWKGEPYEWIAKNQRPDHLAILPDEVGACSIKKGCGLFVNSRGKCSCGTADGSYDARQRRKLARSGKALPDGSFPIVNESDLKNAIGAFGRAKDRVATKKHITNRAKRMGKTKLLPKKWNKVKASLNPVLSDPALSSHDLVLLNSSQEFRPMLSPKKKVRMVRELIANSGTWEINDKKTLMSMPDSALKKVYNSAIEDDDSEGSVLIKKKKKVILNKSKDEPEVEVPAEKKKKFKSVSNKEDWKKLLPPEAIAVLNQGQKMIQRRKDALIEAITNNENNVFTDKWLGAQDPDVLEGIAALAANSTEGDADGEDGGMFLPGFKPNYAGAAGTIANNRRGKRDESEEDEDGLTVPDLFTANSDDEGDEEDRPAKKKKK